METAIKFKHLELEQETQIFNRVRAGIGKQLPKGWRLTLSMDLAAANANVGLDVDKLLAFADMDFYHDICGIMRHMDRTSGKLGDCFLPRCAR